MIRYRIRGRLRRKCLALALLFLITMVAASGTQRARGFDPTAALEFTMQQGALYCLECHDGVLATRVHQGHAVGTNYLLAQMRAGSKLKPLGALDPGLVLKDGTIVCTTCHHPESPHHSKLVMSNAGSRLCLACHNV